jgi:hypothetical protein
MQNAHQREKENKNKRKKTAHDAPSLFAKN